MSVSADSSKTFAEREGEKKDVPTPLINHQLGMFFLAWLDRSRASALCPLAGINVYRGCAMLSQVLKWGCVRPPKKDCFFLLFCFFLFGMQ